MERAVRDNTASSRDKKLVKPSHQAPRLVESRSNRAGDSESSRLCKLQPREHVTGPLPAFHIPEVLEGILVEVPILDLITSCRRVCQHWRRVIDKSPHMKRHISRSLACHDLVTERVTGGRFPTLSLTPVAQELLERFWRRLLRLYLQTRGELSRGGNWHPDAGFVSKLYDLYKPFIRFASQTTAFPPVEAETAVSRAILLTKSTNMDTQALKTRDCSLFERRFGAYPVSKESSLPNILYLQCFKAFNRLLDDPLDPGRIIRLVGKNRVRHRNQTDFLNFWAVYRKDWPMSAGSARGRDVVLEEADRSTVVKDHQQGRGPAAVEPFSILFEMKNGGSVRLMCDGGKYEMLPPKS
ncbi:hypothetical protein TWF481_010958 [Arthrobotrys musiformis]|uniref:F-box domain-containing protein n=1 Tax=Arthrobotrys musiformis TaxID=47236 RepID=A0AAV9VZU9_9PEZI